LASKNDEKVLDMIEKQFETGDDDDDNIDLSNTEENEDDDDDDDNFEKRSLTKRDLSDSRLRNCIKCVGQQREKGSSVKQATGYCNKMCKRNLFENDLGKRFYYWRQRG
jgi:hypothetical protein